MSSHAFTRYCQCTAKPSLQSPVVPVSVQVLSNPWKSSPIHWRINFHLGHQESHCGKLQVRAVATLKPKCSIPKQDGRNNNLQLSGATSTQPEPLETGDSDDELEESEKLRRMRISKENKGNTPSNKGRKHSAETLQWIRERTRLAMQNPKVKMKLVNLGHAQSEEMRVKIGVRVRMGWERRRGKLMLQETCHFEWMNLIA
ncbi:peroxisome bioproteinsis protein 2 [Hibiscus syriacus]|uniref:Peroxisome bioproteinsis protein 2 n=1 Tax=Hibiscus syriacus TaxID=106335 RepID=A0A6A3AW17_HIBSY|nr:peroxisome bioproteinsis protein 2 [Hibiscus syriacus]